MFIFRPLYGFKIYSPASLFSLKFGLVIQRGISTSSIQLKNFRSPVKFTKFSHDKLTENEETGPDQFSDADLSNLLDRTILQCGSGHRVYVIQPYIKWGPKKKRNTTPQLQLLESVTLIKTLREWKVVGETIIGLESFNKKYFFGKGNLEAIKNMIEQCPVISAIFLSVDILSLAQQMTLQEYFGIPIFDRYTIIMHIFREHASSREAKLQIQLAELPYLWTVMKGISLGIGEKFGGGAHDLGGYGPKILDYRKEIFRAREAKIKKALIEVREHRKEFRKARAKKEIPVVAVVGYTNSGKTSLIKALTEKESLEPQDYLFATLDVTSHLGKLPSNLKVYYVDTLGFISDIPTYLIESFMSTLEDATEADVIIHVRDVSHPDTVAQNDNVLKTLSELNMSQNQMDNVITVGNKIDKVEEEGLREYKEENMILVSSTKLTGIDILRQEIEKKLLKVAGRIPMTVRVATGGQEYDWLHLHSTIVYEEPDPNNSQYIILKVIISSSQLAKFKHHFIEHYKKS